MDGGFANLAPYTPEMFPTSLRTHGMGLAWAVSGLGRIIGPLVIALVAGTGDLVDPEATLDALAPSFLFLAASALLVGIGFLLVANRTPRRDLETLAAELAEEAAHPAGGASRARADLARRAPSARAAPQGRGSRGNPPQGAERPPPRRGLGGPDRRSYQR